MSEQNMQPNDMEPQRDSIEKVEALLDQALAPESPSPEMVNRIVSGTLPHVRPGNPVMRLARGSGLGFRIAAAVLLVVSLGVLFWGSGEYPAENNHGEIPSLAVVDDQITQLAQASLGDAEDIDGLIDLVDLQLTLLQAGELWTSAEESMEEAVTLYEIEYMDMEMNWIF